MYQNVLLRESAFKMSSRNGMHVYQQKLSSITVPLIRQTRSLGNWFYAGCHTAEFCTFMQTCIYRMFTSTNLVKPAFTDFNCCQTRLKLKSIPEITVKFIGEWFAVVFGAQANLTDVKRTMLTVHGACTL